MSDHTCPHSLEHVRYQQSESVSLSKTIGCNKPRTNVLCNLESARVVPVESVKQDKKRNREPEVKCDVPCHVPIETVKVFRCIQESSVMGRLGNHGCFEGLGHFPDRTDGVSVFDAA